jgi:hypothetical protein
MSDLAKWKVHGPVRSLKSTFAEWNLTKEEWGEPRRLISATFRPNGTLDETSGLNPDGTLARRKCLYDEAGRLIEIQAWLDETLEWQTLYSYDDAGRHLRTASVSQDGSRKETEASTYDSAGRRTTVRFLGSGASAYAIEGSEIGYSAPGATTITTLYQANDLPVEVLFHNVQNVLVRRVSFTRNSDGKLLSEECPFGEQDVLGILDKQADQSAEAREQLAGIIEKVFGSGFTGSNYAYDERGRVRLRITRMGMLMAERTTFSYDEHDNPIEQTTVHEGCEFDADERGELRPQNEKLDTQHTRFEYQYDGEGNWTERVVWSRLEPNPNFQRSNVERREISYHAREGAVSRGS